MDPADPTALDLDRAHGEIQHRWFVWTAAGLKVHPATWTDRDPSRPMPLVGRSDVVTPWALGLRVSRPDARAGIVLSADGRTEIAVRRPGSDTTVREAAQVDSVEAFGFLLDRVVEPITWSGVRKDPGGPAPTPPPRSTGNNQWVLGHDGLPMAKER